LNGNLNIKSGNLVTSSLSGNIFTNTTSLFIGGNTGKTIINDGCIGNLFIGTTTNANNKWLSTGVCTATSFNALSDYRIKENIRPIIHTIDNLNPIHYVNKNTKLEDIGLIAHELQESIPFLVTGEKDGTELQSVNYIGLIGLLIKEIQELKKRVFILEKEMVNK
jgi:hypothetical protein